MTCQTAPEMSRNPNSRWSEYYKVWANPLQGTSPMKRQRLEIRSGYRQMKVRKIVDTTQFQNVFHAIRYPIAPALKMVSPIARRRCALVRRGFRLLADVALLLQRLATQQSLLFPYVPTHSRSKQTLGLRWPHGACTTTRNARTNRWATNASPACS